jgi:hypothetical protein
MFFIISVHSFDRTAFSVLLPPFLCHLSVWWLFTFLLPSLLEVSRAILDLILETQSSQPEDGLVGFWVDGYIWVSEPWTCKVVFSPSLGEISHLASSHSEPGFKNRLFYFPFQSLLPPFGAGSPMGCGVFSVLLISFGFISSSPWWCFILYWAWLCIYSLF